MAIAYRFSDETPTMGSIVHAFRKLEDLKEFTRMQGSKGTQKFWEVEGEIDSDDGRKDGIKIRVSSVKEIF